MMANGSRATTGKLALFFFFNAVFAFCAALFLHELGHAVMIKLIYGYFPQISINPMAGGYVSYYGAPASSTDQLWISSGGMILGLAAGLLCAGSGVWLWRSVWAAPVILLGIVSLSVNALMLTAGYFLFSSGDIHRMIAHGFPLGGAVVLGLAGLLFSGYVLMRALPYFGLDHTSTLPQKYLVLGSGVVLYGGLVLMVPVFTQDMPELVKKGTYVLTTLGVLAGGLFLVDWGMRHLPGPRQSAHPVSSAQLGVSFVLAATAFIWIGF
ncbi:MAG: hypothetical protein K8I00_08235 [Candidatus Omnitrophica bacterium]|nr:hypothetical protein [Candidatus Omnitrophota bacterium]